MTPDQKSIAIAKILKRTTQEKLDNQQAILDKLKQNEGKASDTGFLVVANSVKKAASIAVKNQTEVVKQLQQDLKNLDKCIEEKPEK